MERRNAALKDAYETEVDGLERNDARFSRLFGNYFFLDQMGVSSMGRFSDAQTPTTGSSNRTVTRAAREDVQKGNQDQAWQAPRNENYGGGLPGYQNWSDYTAQRDGYAHSYQQEQQAQQQRLWSIAQTEGRRLLFEHQNVYREQARAALDKYLAQRGGKAGTAGLHPDPHEGAGIELRP